MHIKRLGVRAFLAKVGTGFATKNATDKDLAFLAKVGSSFNVLSPSGYLRTGICPTASLLEESFVSYRFAT